MTFQGKLLTKNGKELFLMNKQEINIYREIQRNTEMAMKALDAVTDKIYDDRLAATVADQEL